MLAVIFLLTQEIKKQCETKNMVIHIQFEMIKLLQLSRFDLQIFLKCFVIFWSGAFLLNFNHIFACILDADVLTSISIDEMRFELTVIELGSTNQLIRKRTNLCIFGVEKWMCGLKTSCILYTLNWYSWTYWKLSNKKSEVNK